MLEFMLNVGTNVQGEAVLCFLLLLVCAAARVFFFLWGSLRGVSPMYVQPAKVSLINYQPALDQITVQLLYVGILFKQHLT